MDYGIQYTATLDYVVSVRVVDDENNPVANCNEDGVAGSYLLYTVPDDRSWGRKVTLSALCISGLGSKTLVVELDFTHFKQRKRERLQLNGTG